MRPPSVLLNTAGPCGQVAVPAHRCFAASRHLCYPKWTASMPRPIESLACHPAGKQVCQNSCLPSHKLCIFGNCFRFTKACRRQNISADQIALVWVKCKSLWQDMAVMTHEDLLACMKMRHLQRRQQVTYAPNHICNEAAMQKSTAAAV